MSYGKDDSYSSNTRGSGYDDDSYGTGRGDLRRDATTRSNDGLASGGRGYDEDDTYGSSGARGTRRNDGLETSTGGAYGTDTQGYGSSTTRRNDGLSSGMDDSYEARSSGYDSTRANDGLATSGDDSYGGSTGRRRDDEYSSRTADQDLSGGLRSDRTTGGRYDDSSYGERTSGGLGRDDTMGTYERTGGVGRGGDQQTSRYTSGGLGQDDAYGSERQAGGNDTGYDGNYGMGSGRTERQERGGMLPTESGYSGSQRRHDERDYDNDDDNDTSGGNTKKESTMGKLMEKAGGMLGSSSMQSKGANMRGQSGRDDY